MSIRTQRVASEIRKLLAEELRDHLHDPRIPTITSFTRVEVSPDLMVARVHVSVMAPPAKQELCLEALQGAAGHLRYRLGRELKLRRMPELEFRLDHSVQGSFQTVETIDRVMRELGEVPDFERARAGQDETAAPDELPNDEPPAAPPPGDEPRADEEM